FQAEDGIRGGHVTGVQTCALPILFQLADRPAYDHVGQHRRGCLTDGTAPAAKPDRAELAVVELEVEGDDITAEGVVAFLGDVCVGQLPEIVGILVVVEDLLAVEIIHQLNTFCAFSMASTSWSTSAGRL